VARIVFCEDDTFLQKQIHLIFLTAFAQRVDVEECTLHGGLVICSNHSVQRIYELSLGLPSFPRGEALEEEAVKADSSRKNTSGKPIWEILQQLNYVVQRRVADFRVVALIYLPGAAIVAYLFIWICIRPISVFATQEFGPPGACSLWLPCLITFYVGADILIGFAYICISATLIYLVYTMRRTIPFQWAFAAFGIFIITCAVMPFLSVLTLWTPVSWLLAMVKLLAALTSVPIVLALPSLVSRTLSFFHLARLSDERRRQLEQAHSDLEALYEKSQDLDRVKMAFFANISHELRTPLTLILGPTRTLLAAQQLGEEQRNALLVVQRNALTLLKHVNDLLSLAQLEERPTALNTTKVDLALLLWGCAAHFEALAQDNRIAFIVERPASVQAYVDAKRFQSICLNLLSNAFKFTPAGGIVRCMLRRKGEWAIITVQDSGPGIRPELRQVIFERFRQGEDDLTRRLGGTGLGLAIVKEFVELHGGSITVDDAPEGGALFSVELPLELPASTLPQPALFEVPVALEQVSPCLPDLSRESVYRQDSEQAHQFGATEGPLPLVLVIEDHQDMARFLMDVLTHEYRVVTARDGLDGLRKALTLQPDLMLCDIVMPRISGEQFVTQVRTHRALDGIPIMILSARADDALRIQLLREGVQEYLVKPFLPEELRVRAANLIAMKQARQVLQQDVVTQNQNLVFLAREASRHMRERQQALEELQRANEQLAHASQVQRNFVAIVSHEFRTALAGIQGFSELIRQETFSQEEIKEYAGDIFTEAQRFSRMITDLLDLERIKSGQMSLILERVDLNALVRDVVERLRPAAQRHSFDLQLDNLLPECLGDRDKLSQVITNLLSNAIKYSPDGKKIVVGSQVEQKFAQVWVQDYGMGIPPDALEKVFIPYFRVEAGATRFIKGTGLGLSIAHQMIEMQGGQIWIESSLGQGSCFHFTIPLA
jgi:signal transduction histidine kinase